MNAKQWMCLFGTGLTLTLSADEINVKATGLWAVSGEDVAAKVEATIAAAPSGSDVFFPAGEYFFRRTVRVVGKTNVVFRGEAGTRLVAHFASDGSYREIGGLFEVRDSSDLVFRNLTATTDIPHGWSGRIAALDPANGTYDVKIASRYAVTGDEMICRVDTCDEDGTPDWAILDYRRIARQKVTDAQGIVRERAVCIPYTVIGDRLIRVTAPHGEKSWERPDWSRLRVGQRILFRHGYVPGLAMFDFERCDRVRLQDIEVERTTTCGVRVMPPASDFAFERFNIRMPKDGDRYYYSSPADGIHFGGLSGTLSLRDCHFWGLGDDILNVHSRAGFVKSHDATTGRTALVYRSEYERERPLPKLWARSGSRLAFYEPKTFREKGVVTVDGFAEGCVTVRNAEFVVEEGDIVANLDDQPDVRISGCSVRNTRGRAFLLQTRSFCVENCDIRNTSLPGILVAPDGRQWSEVGPTRRGVIRNCTFMKCGVARTGASAGAIVVKASHDGGLADYSAGVHQNIRIEGCRFDACANAGICVSATDGVAIENNVFQRCATRVFDERRPEPKHDIWLLNCRNVSLSGNETDRTKRHLFVENVQGVQSAPPRLYVPGDVTRRPHFGPPVARHDPKSRRFTGIPSVCVTPQGRLWVTWYAGVTPNEDANNYVVLATSGDSGKTWREVAVYDPDGAGPVRSFDPSVWVTPDGRLLWNWSELLPGYGGVYECDGNRLFLAFGDDAEQEIPTWSAIQPLGKGIVLEKPQVLRDGSWLLPVADWYAPTSTVATLSQDAGRSWTRVGGVTVPIERRMFDETRFVRLSDGRLRAYIRTDRGPDGAWEAESSDDGRTWNAPRPCPFSHPSSRLLVRRLRSGRLLLVKNGRLNQGYERNQMIAYVSEDDGKSWKGGLVLDARKNVSYPDADQAADGTIFAVWDRERMSEHEILLTRFTEADVMLGGTHAMPMIVSKGGRDEQGE